MQLPIGQRREIIEDILDIQIFTVMNTVLKEKISQSKETIRDIESQVEVSKQKAILQKQYIDTLESDKKTKIEDIQTQINEIEVLIATLNNSADETSKKKDALGNPESKKAQLEKYKEKFEAQIKKVQGELDFYENHDDCPTCKQGIPHDFKSQIKTERERKIDELQEATGEVEKQYTELSSVVEEFISLSNKIIEINNEIITNQKYLTRLTAEITHAKANVADIQTERKKLKELAKLVVSNEKLKSEKNEEQHYLNMAASLLKDTGIKTRIIRQYLPVINKLVNKYLQAMDFFVQFDLDEKFNETIKSRHRDNLSYASFSEGEKQRIDLALLFTWRTIAKMKNSAATNLLILDEVFDSSLDNTGTDYVMSLLSTIGVDTNVFVISHKGDQLFDKFRGVIRFEKKQNYSVMV